MDKRTNISAALYNDEIIRFLAERYRVSPREIVRHFLARENNLQAPEPGITRFRLEENEMEMLRGLTDAGRP